MPLVGIPSDGDLAVIDSNYGQERTPGLVYNLEANPSATVEWRGSSAAATARRADEARAQQILTDAVDIYSGFREYPKRAAHRDIRVFVLEAAEAAGH